MNLDQAINNVKNVLENFRGTLAEHHILSESLKTILNKIPNEPPEPENEKTSNG